MKSLVFWGLTCLLALFGCSAVESGGGGKYSKEKEVTPEIANYVKDVEDDIIKALACTDVAYSEPLTPLKYREQVVAGMNYIVSVQVGSAPGAKVIHVKIYRDLRGNVSLTGVVAEPGTKISPFANYEKCFSFLK